MTANKSPLRSHTMELLLAYQQNPSIKLRNQLVRLNAGLVRKMAHRFSHKCAEPYEDLEQIGYLGLIRAIERFNMAKDCAFSSYAVPYIRGEILHFLRDRSNTVKVPRRLQDLYKDGLRVKDELARSLQRQPRDNEIAEKLGVSISEWTEACMALRNRMPLSLDATISQQIDSPMTLGETIPDQHYQALQRHEEERQQIQGAFSQLEHKTRAVVELVFLSELSRKEVAEQMGVSPMTVTRRLQRGLDQLVCLLQPQQFRTEP